MSAAPPLLIGLDIGTSGVKGALCTQDGEVRARRRVPIQVSRPQPGWAEHDPAQWWAAVQSIVSQLLADTSGGPAQVAALGISGVCPVVVPVDQRGDHLRPAMLYSIDRRASIELAELAAQVSDEEAIRRSGQALGPQNLLAKAIWLRRNEPRVWEGTAQLLGSTGYLVRRLTGHGSIDHFSAADGGLGYDLAGRSWDLEALGLAGVSVERMPTLHWPSEVIGVVHAEAAEATGLARGTPVIAGTGDALADLVASGATRPGEGALLYGTSMSTMVLSTDPSRSPSVVTVPGWQPGQLVHSAILPMGIGIFEWWARWCGTEWDQASLATINEYVRASAPGARGLLHIPHLTGGRHAHAAGEGAVLGMKVEHTAADRVRAIAEGLAHALRAELVGSQVPSELRAIGAGADLREVVQTVSDVCGIVQEIPRTAADAAVGVANLAAQAAGLIDSEDPQPWTTAISTITPQARHLQLYESQQERFDRSARMLDALAADHQRCKERNLV